MIALTTPAEQHAHRLELAYSDILKGMDNPLSYTLDDDRYDIWRWDGKSFYRGWIALSYKESQIFLRDMQGEDQLGFLVPHVHADQAAWFFFCIAKAGQDALKYMQQAEDAAKLPDEPKQPKARKPRAKKTPAKDLCACEVHA